jgi:hypothetical protein
MVNEEAGDFGVSSPGYSKRMIQRAALAGGRKRTRARFYYSYAYVNRITSSAKYP